MSKKYRCPNCRRYTAEKKGGLFKRLLFGEDSGYQLYCSYCKAKSELKREKVQRGVIFRQTIGVIETYRVNDHRDWATKWRKLRIQALSRAKNKCQRCGSQLNLDVHHKKLVTKGGKDELSNLVVLCETCHHKAHS